ncbi:helix-turn-helix domain-containing protein [Actinocatenispora sera]|uniref:helix-turn-helix domain-containing protein n=1 Tax=Actinocatenispora sera TaxID=390989 RepID=UPI0033C0C733
MHGEEGQQEQREPARKLVPASDAARLLDIEARWIYEWCRSKQLPSATKRNGRMLVSVDEVAALDQRLQDRGIGRPRKPR